MEYTQIKGIPGEGDIIRYGNVYFKLGRDSILAKKYFIATALNTGRDGSMTIEIGKRKIVDATGLPAFKYVQVAEG